MKIKAFITHKKSEEFEDCQDSFQLNPVTKSVAVSDGVSQSLYPKLWADLVANAYVNRNWECDSPQMEKAMSNIWHWLVTPLVDRLRPFIRRIVQTKLNNGNVGAATLVGIRFKGQKWEGKILGDSCLIEVYDNKIINIFSSKTNNQFDNHPDYFDAELRHQGKVRNVSGELKPYTTLLLVSDPFSDLFEKAYEKDQDISLIKELLKVKNENDFELLINYWRRFKSMKNDDSTMVVIEYDGEDAFNIVYDKDRTNNHKCPPREETPKTENLTSFDCFFNM